MKKRKHQRTRAKRVFFFLCSSSSFLPQAQISLPSFLPFLNSQHHRQHDRRHLSARGSFSFFAELRRATSAAWPLRSFIPSASLRGHLCPSIRLSDKDRPLFLFSELDRGASDPNGQMANGVPIHLHSQTGNQSKEKRTHREKRK